MLPPARDLEMPGEFSSTRSYAFEFNNVEMPYESYNGVNVRLKCAPYAAAAVSWCSASALRLAQLLTESNRHPCVGT